MNGITLKHEGGRLYIVGDTSQIKWQLDKAGATFDRVRRTWWISPARRAAIEALLNQQTASVREGGK